MISYWGPIIWHIIHNIAYNCNENDLIINKPKYIIFYKHIAAIIPCVICKSEYNGMIRLFPPEKYFTSKQNLIAWTVHIHNTVNRKLNKKIYRDISDVKDFYENTDIIPYILKLLIIYKEHIISNDMINNYIIYDFLKFLIDVFNREKYKNILINYFIYTNKVASNGLLNYNMFKSWLQNLIDIIESN